MKIVAKTAFDELVALHSRETQVSENTPGVVQLQFGPVRVHLTEDSARDFLYQLTGFFARKDLAEYEHESDAALQESKDALTALSFLHSRRP